MLSPIYTDPFHNDRCLEFTVSTSTGIGSTYCSLIALNVVEYSLNVGSVCLVSLGYGDGQVLTSSTEGLGKCEAHVVSGGKFGDFAGDPHVQLYVTCTTHTVCT